MPQKLDVPAYSIRHGSKDSWPCSSGGGGAPRRFRDSCSAVVTTRLLGDKVRPSFTLMGEFFLSMSSGELFGSEAPISLASISSRSLPAEFVRPTSANAEGLSTPVAALWRLYDRQGDKAIARPEQSRVEHGC